MILSFIFHFISTSSACYSFFPFASSFFSYIQFNLKHWQTYLVSFFLFSTFFLFFFKLFLTYLIFSTSTSSIYWFSIISSSFLFWTTSFRSLRWIMIYVAVYVIDKDTNRDIMSRGCLGVVMFGTKPFKGAAQPPLIIERNTRYLGLWFLHLGTE